MKTIIRVLIFLFCFSNIHAQQNTVKYIDSMMSAIPYTTNDTLKARTYKAIAEKCLISLPQKTLYYASLGLQHTKKMNWQKGIAVFNDIIGRYYSNKGEGDSAILYFEIAYEIDIKNGLNFNAASTLNNIGVVYQNQAKYEKAVEKFTQALQIAESEKNNSLIALCNQNIGQIYLEQGNYVKCIEIYKKVILIYQKDDNQDGVASAYSSLASTYLYLKDTVNAKYYFTNAIDVFIKTENKLELATAYTDISILENDIATRIEIKQKAQKIWDEYSPSHLTSSTNLANLGLEYFNIVRYNLYYKIKTSPSIPQKKDELLKLAKQCLLRALQYSETQRFISNIASQSGLLAELEAYVGDYKNAYLHYKTHALMTDSIFSQENKNNIATIVGKREVLLKDKEIELNKQAIAAQHKQNIGLAIGLLLIATIGFLYYNQSQNRKKANTQLSTLNMQLNDANKLKAKFFAILSHDLRSPISNLINFLYLQKNAPEVLDAMSTEAYQDKITTSAETLLENMETMLLWSKGQMQQFKPAIDKVYVESLFTNLKSNFSNYNNIEFQYINPLDAYLESDANFLQIIMQNLTNNAIKALNPNKANTIAWEASTSTNGKVQLKITDSGKGLSKQQIDTLLSNENVTSQKNGLGFFIVKDLAKAIDLTIQITSVEGEQTTITLSS